MIAKIVNLCYFAAVARFALFTLARGLAGDGNFTAAIGAPTLDGIGAVGAHAAHESVPIERMADRVALLVKLTAGILWMGRMVAREGQS